MYINESYSKMRYLENIYFEHIEVDLFTYTKMLNFLLNTTKLN